VVELGRCVRKGGKRQKLEAFMQGCSATYLGHKPDAPGQVQERSDEDCLVTGVGSSGCSCFVFCMLLHP
jgi:hypothetical protein